MTIESYLGCRDAGMTLAQIQEEQGISEATVWSFELGYQCYLKNMPLDDAVNLVKKSG